MTTSMFEKTIGRRVLLKGTAAAAVALAAGRKAFAQEPATIRIMGVETAALDDWNAFESETGLKVEFTGINSDPGIFRQEVVANSAGDNIDIFLMDGGIQTDLGTKGFFMEIDGDKVPTWSDLPDSMRNSPLITAEGKLYGVPAVLNADSFAYYPEMIGEEEPLSYALLFESEKTLGKVGLENTWLTTFPMAATYMKVSRNAAIADPSNMTAEEAKLVADFLVERKKAGQFRLLWSTFDESVDAMARKETIVSNVWEPAVKELVRQGEKVRYAFTKEGYNKWLIAAFVPSQVADRGNEDIVYRALGGLLGGAYGARIAELRGYTTGRPQAALETAKAAGASAEQIEAIEANIAKVETKFAAPLFWQNAAPDNLSAIEAEWERFRQA